MRSQTFREGGPIFVLREPNQFADDLSTALPTTKKEVVGTP